METAPEGDNLASMTAETSKVKPGKPPPIYAVNSSIKDIISIVSTLGVPKSAFQIKGVNL